MKKSIKYAGIAAATLLAVAPVAAPVVSNVTTVKADSSSATTDYQGVENAADDFKDAFNGNVKAATLGTELGAATSDLDLGNQQDYSTFITSDAAKAIATGTIGDGTNEKDVLANSDRNAKVTVTAKYKDGAAITDNGDLVKVLNNNKLPEVVFTVQLDYKDFNGNKASRTASFTATKDDTNDLTSVKASFTTPLDVALNSQTTSAELTSSANVSILDQDGNKLNFNNTTATDGYYYTYNGALNAGTNKVSTDVIKYDKDGNNGKFVKAGTYYQAITVAPGTNLAQFITDYQNDPTSNPIYVNGKVASEGSDFNISTDGKTLTFVRTINVASSDSQWTTEDTTGVVTTKSDSSFYTLKDDNNNTVANRGLAKNTAWKTDKVRTDQNGNKQYRVATGEWIDANNVTFSDKATDNNGEGAYTDVKALNGKVVTAGPAGFYYPLYDDNGKMVSDRGVAGETAWYTDKSAVNADGVTVYHVATGEWLQGTNATYTAY